MRRRDEAAVREDAWARQRLRYLRRARGAAGDDGRSGAGARRPPHRHRLRPACRAGADRERRRGGPRGRGGDGPRAPAGRRTGIGCDQLIVLEPSESADVRMRIWNADGGEVSACGNASRCVALLLGGETSIETAGGLLQGSVLNGSASVEMGQPRFGWDEVPLAYPMDTAV